jgi:hypothetical protein
LTQMDTNGSLEKTSFYQYYQCNPWFVLGSTANSETLRPPRRASGAGGTRMSRIACLTKLEKFALQG